MQIKTQISALEAMEQIDSQLSIEDKQLKQLERVATEFNQLHYLLVGRFSKQLSAESSRFEEIQKRLIETLDRCLTESLQTNKIPDVKQLLHIYSLIDQQSAAFKVCQCDL